MNWIEDQMKNNPPGGVSRMSPLGVSPPKSFYHPTYCPSDGYPPPLWWLWKHSTEKEKDEDASRKRRGKPLPQQEAADLKPPKSILKRIKIVRKIERKAEGWRW